MARKFRFGFDTGGTFTDLVLFCEESCEAWIGKVPSTPDQPARAVISGFELLTERAGIEHANDTVLVFGATTLVANRLIERKGACTALITTQGFRDLLEMRREMRYDLYDLQLEFPQPLVPRKHRYEVEGRLDKDGKELLPLNTKELRDLAQEIAKNGVESIAVCLLNSYRSAQHEEEISKILAQEIPDIPVSLSAHIVSEIREYERASTTVANAYIKPVMTRHVDELADELEARGSSEKPYFMLSNGGIVSADSTKNFPIRLAESGPAAGVLAAALIGRKVGRSEVLSFDMGGTTAKLGLIIEGKPTTTTDFEVARVHRFKKFSGLPIKIPVIEIIEIGAGGGSIAHVDKLGLLKVGPESAEANPGPACYKFGGENPTVTDANLLLGYLDASFFLGGEMELDQDLAEKAVTEKLGHPLGVDCIQASAGVHDIVNENMIKAAKVYIAEQGKDSRTLTMVAFGGMGPIHARKIAKALNIGTLIIPPRAGVSSAVGLLVAPVAMDAVRSFITPVDQNTDWDYVNQLYDEMQVETYSILNEIAPDRDSLAVERSVDMRYLGQGFEINVPLELGSFGVGSEVQIQAAFEQAYEARYGGIIEGMPAQVVNWRMVLKGSSPDFQIEKLIEKNESDGDPKKGEREVYFSEVNGFVDSAVYDRSRLKTGDSFPGPAVVEERESTSIVGPGEELTIDDGLNLVISL